MKHKRAGRKKLKPIHPGEVLEDVLREAGISANALAIQIRVPGNRITAILNGKRGITADTALRLARYFGTSPEFWMNLQLKYDIETAEDALAIILEREITPRSAA